MKTMFRTGWGTEINELEVIKTSEKSVWFKCPDGRERRELFKTNYYVWFKTREDAVSYLMDKYKSKVSACEHRLESAKKDLDKLLKELKK